MLRRGIDLLAQQEFVLWVSEGRYREAALANERRAGEERRRFDLLE